MRQLMLAVVAVSMLCGPAARADDQLPRPGAREHFELGEKLYRAADHAGALKNFVKAYKLQPLPTLLFDIARCHEVLGHRKPAIKYYLLYLEKLPKAKNRDLVELRIVNLTMQENSARSDGKGQAGDGAPSIPSALLEGPRPVQDTWRSTAGIICLAAGGATMITGVIFGAMAKSRADEYNIGVDKKDVYAYLYATDRQGRRFETVQIATLVAGGAVIAGGVALLLWDRLAGQAGEKPIISPFATDRTLGISGRITF